MALEHSYISLNFTRDMQRFSMGWRTITKNRDCSPPNHGQAGKRDTRAGNQDVPAKSGTGGNPLEWSEAYSTIISLSLPPERYSIQISLPPSPPDGCSIRSCFAISGSFLAGPYLQNRPKVFPRSQHWHHTVWMQFGFLAHQMARHYGAWRSMCTEAFQQVCFRLRRTVGTDAVLQNLALPNCIACKK